ncbi:MAG: 23S rRNA (uracil(1939)-C(5))-methyltransferase RlmD [Candidatus Gracilibacteria bacterium]
MKPKKGQEIELKIDRLVYGGEGIADFEGFKIFVDAVCPGDLALTRVIKVRSNYAEAKLLKIVKESPLRIKPKCKHFTTCGGCKWQFLPYEEQVKIKEEQVCDAITRLGGLDAKLVQKIIANSTEFFYRNKLELSFGKGKNGEMELGFYPPGYHHEVCDLEECFLESEEVAKIVKIVRKWANDYSALGLRSLTIREGKNTGERMLILTVSDAEFEASPFDAKESFKELFSKNKSVSSLYLSKVSQIKGQPTVITDVFLAGKETLNEVLLLPEGEKLSFEILPGAFFQTNTVQAQVLYAKALELASLTGSEIVFDLYSGTGTIGLFCAHKAKKVICVEINESAVKNAKFNAEKNGIENVEFYLGAVEDKLDGLKEKPDIIIVDPPRAGLGEKVVETVSKFDAKKIVYVSCNPATMARDLKQFGTLGYKTELVQPVDMFPQTHHTECVSLLTRVN